MSNVTLRSTIHKLYAVVYKPTGLYHLSYKPVPSSPLNTQNSPYPSIFPTLHPSIFPAHILLPFLLTSSYLSYSHSSTFPTHILLPFPTHILLTFLLTSFCLSYLDKSHLRKEQERMFPAI